MTPPLPPPARPIPVALLGATGAVGQRFVRLLDGHPWFRLERLCASERSAGRPYAEVVRWRLPGAPPRAVAERLVEPPPREGVAEPLVFSALDASVAGELERACAGAGSLVVTNARNHRMDADVPLLVPEVNADHLGLLARGDRGAGAIVANPNCSTIGVTLALAPLARAFGVRRAHVVTLQARSGAGLVGGDWLPLEDDVVPYIAGEEDKLETETAKILGALEGGAIGPAGLAVSAQCNRVPVLDGHVACVSVELERAAEASEIVDAWRAFRGRPQELELPSAPRRPLHVIDTEDGPRPALHRDLEGGMAASVGRLRPCPLLGWKFVTLSHNTVRGAAGGAILAAELAVAEGHLPASS